LIIFYEKVRFGPLTESTNASFMGWVIMDDMPVVGLLVLAAG